VQDHEPNLRSALTALKGVGPALAAKLERLNLYRIEDLLFLLPLRYEDRSNLVPIGSLKAGDRCLMEGEVLLAETVFRGRRSLLVRISDGTGQITLRYFYFSRQQQSQFVAGARVSAFGDVRAGSGGLEMVHPEYHRVDGENEQDMEESLTPIYPTTEGMHQLSWRGMTDKALVVLAEHPQGLPDLLPEALLRSLEIRLGAPNYPHDTVTMSGSVLSKRSEEGRGVIELGLRGYNRIGDHVTGSVVIELPARSVGRVQR